ncbi:MAG: hypothetical protein P4L50_26375 [Anaerolineaceae bacterium]|nr:hypothetical protein [Anaerolineaceae bacterium]
MTAPTMPDADILETVGHIWNIPYQPCGCPQCGQVLLVKTESIGKNCPNCGRSKLIPQPALLRSEPPELVIPYQIQQANLASIYAGFTKGIWLHSDDFEVDKLLSNTTAVYWPMWLLDSDVSGDWQSEAGFDYQVETSHDIFTNSNWESQKVLENRIRWEPRVGQMKRHYDNIALQATTDYQKLLNLTGNYQLHYAIPFNPSFLKDSDIRVPDIQPENVWPTAKPALDKIVLEDCRKAADAHFLRNFTLHASYGSCNWTQLLFPVFITFYTDDAGNPQFIYVNGQTGKIGGPRLASQKKGWKSAAITAAVAISLLILALIFFGLAALLPLFSAFGVVLIVAAFITGLFAIIPAVWPWQWNRQQQDQKIISS